jgi:hypothetical protein
VEEHSEASRSRAPRACVLSVTLKTVRAPSAQRAVDETEGSLGSERSAPEDDSICTSENLASELNGGETEHPAANGEVELRAHNGEQVGIFTLLAEYRIS